MLTLVSAYLFVVSKQVRAPAAPPLTAVLAVQEAAQDGSTPEVTPRYPTHRVIATVFWIGESADESNGYIANDATAWDEHAIARFGGIDDPSGRNFDPQHNPYYIALPAAEFDDRGNPSGRTYSYWSEESAKERESLFKGRWVRIVASGKTVYAQWLDVGPYQEYDYAYVFGASEPKNDQGLKAGIDLSPSAAISLGFYDGAVTVTWQFVDENEVPPGPWRQYPPISRQTYWQ